MQIQLKDFKKNPEKHIEATKKEPLIIKKLTKPYAVVISYEIYKTLLEGAWAEQALKYADEKTKNITKKNIEKQNK